MKSLATLLMIAATAVAHGDPCEAIVADAPARFATLAEGSPEREALLLSVAQCHYRDGRWREFFGLARYVRAFPGKTAAARRLALLEVLGSLRHCRFDRAKEVFATVPAGTPALDADRRRIELALAALPGDPKHAPQPGQKSPISRGVVEKAMHWPVSFEDETLRKADPFRFQVNVASRCTVIPEASR